MKKVLYFSIIFIAIFSFMAIFRTPILNSDLNCSNFAKADTNRQSSYILMEASTGKVMDGENIDVPLYMASTTKIMTALIVIENCDLNSEFIIPEQSVGIEGSSIYLKKGQRWKIIDLLYGLMLRSGNDSAIALAIATSGNVDSFVSKMNEKVAELNLTNTHFVNPHGLHDDNHYTSARDLAIITAEAYTHTEFEEIVSSKTHEYTIDDSKAVFYNKNRLLSSMENANGTKTGYTKNSGRCFVGACNRDGMQLIAVALNIGNMFEKAQQLLEYGFSQYEMKDVVHLNPCALVSGGVSENVALYAKDSFVYPVQKANSSIKYKLVRPAEHVTIHTTALVIDAPVKKDAYVATLEIYDGERLIFETELYTLSSVSGRAEGSHFLEELKRWFNRYANQ